MAMAQFAALALCLLAFAAVAVSGNFNIKGNVYCDTCNVGFVTRISYPIEGAKVEVECRKQGKQTFYKSGATDAQGNFNILCKEEHEKDLCMARAVSASGPCNGTRDVMQGPVYLTRNDGVASDDLLTGPFAFRYASGGTLGSYKAVLAEYTILDDDTI